MRRLFTVEEVNELIPALEVVMGHLLQNAHQIRDAVLATARQLGKHPDEIRAADLIAVRPELERNLEAIREAMAQIAGMGGEVKGLDLGLVDFPSEIDGQEVLLCWQFGEREVGFYHLPDEGFAGRKPLAGSGPSVRIVH
jgi:hypothetical protein